MSDEPKPPFLNRAGRWVMAFLRVASDYDHLIKNEKQGLKSNLYTEMMFVGIGFAVITLGRFLFWDKGEDMFQVFLHVSLGVLLFLPICYCFWAGISVIKNR